MHYSKVALAAAVALATSAAAGTASAQSGMRPFSLGVSGGLSVPTGDTGEGLNSGFNVAGHLGLRPAILPIGLRLDVAYDRWEFDDDGGNFRSLAGVGNVVLNLPRPTGSTVRPYLLGGIGAYSTKGSLDVGNATVEGDSETSLGLSAGAGLDFALSGLSTFVEVRYHSVFLPDVGNVSRPNLNFVPVVFGIRF